jgi:UDP-GlcNAc:undecaprenyl-phosphate GlcNAc-1-phosphate transferase
LNLIYAFTVALFTAIGVMPLLIRYSSKLGLVDIPKDDRRSHKAPIPRSGGIAIAIGIFIGTLLFADMTIKMQAILIGSLLIVVFGVLDDVLDLDYRWKFFGQFLAVGLVLYAGIIFHRLPFIDVAMDYTVVVYVLSGLFLLGVTNAVNLTDGLDGLAGGMTLLTMALLAILAAMAGQMNKALLAMTVIGAILGFLRFNTFPARIFMGDCGSQLLGFLVACLAIEVVQFPASALAPLLSVLLVGLPILDTLMVMTIRLREKRSPFSPDRNHLHHQIMARGLYQYEAVAIIYVLQVTLLLMAFFTRYESDLLHATIYLSFCVTIVGGLSLLRKAQWQYRNPDAMRESERRNRLFRRLEWLYQNTANIMELLVSLLLAGLAAYFFVYQFDEVVRSQYWLFGICTVAVVLLWRNPPWQLRAVAYPATFVLLYYASNAASALAQQYVMGLEITIAIALAIAIRMTRREHFRLDTQDLLVLAAVLILPLLPFDELSRYSVDRMVFRIAIVLYACEFIIGRNIMQRRWLLITTSLLALLAIGI